MLGRVFPCRCFAYPLESSVWPHNLRLSSGSDSANGSRHKRHVREDAPNRTEGPLGGVDKATDKSLLAGGGLGDVPPFV